MRSISRILAVFSKELAQLRRDRMTFGMVVMIPLIQLILFGYAINTNVRDIPIAVVDQSQTGISRILVQMVEATRVVTVTERLTTPEEAEEAIRSARVRAAFILPDDLTQRLAGLQLWVLAHRPRQIRKPAARLLNGLSMARIR
jgi:ABC-2 type transport system permease protein